MKQQGGGGPSKSRFSRFAPVTSTATTSTSTETSSSSSDFLDYDEINLVALEADVSKGNSSSSSSSSAKRKHPGSTDPPPTKLSKGAIHELMETKREEALSKPLSAENKGFQLLAKFGYTKDAGSGGLGKAEKGMQVPISIVKRDGFDRSGIGAIDPIKIKAQALLQQKKMKDVERNQMAVTFQSTLQMQQQQVHVKRLLKKAGRVIFELDSRNQVISMYFLSFSLFRLSQNTLINRPSDDAYPFIPHIPSLKQVTEHDLWPMELKTIPNEDDQDQPSTGISDTDAVDEESQYFTIASTDHTTNVTSAEITTITDGNEERHTISVVVDDPVKQLDSSLMYLRDTYSYCLFCGCQYEDQNDMMTSCPGINEEDHE